MRNAEWGRSSDQWGMGTERGSCRRVGVVWADGRRVEPPPTVAATAIYRYPPSRRVEPPPTASPPARSPVPLPAIYLRQMTGFLPVIGR